MIAALREAHCSLTGGVAHRLVDAGYRVMLMGEFTINSLYHAVVAVAPSSTTHSHGIFWPLIFNFLYAILFQICSLRSYLFFPFTSHTS